MNKIKFVLNGCDISILAEAPEDITLKQLLAQCDKIRPHWCACGVCSYEHLGYSQDTAPEVSINYNDITKVDPAADFDIVELPILRDPDITTYTDKF